MYNIICLVIIMKIKYDIEKLRRVITDFANIAGLSIAVYDSELREVFTYKNKEVVGSFCLSLQKTPEGQNLCICSDHELLLKCRSLAHFVSHTCHAGLTDAVMPIIQNDTILGYIMLGRLKIESDYDNIKDKIKWYGDTESLRESYSHITDYDIEKVKSIANIASIIVAHILLGDMIKQEHNLITEKIIGYIEKNLDKDLTVSTICKEFNISKNVLYDNFHNSLSSTVNEYITGQRIAKAKELLCSTDNPVYEVAESVGIANYQYFCRLFKQRTGYTPLKYRKRQTS